MSEELLLVVRVPLSDIEADLRRRHGLQDPLYDVRLEADAVVMSFKHSPVRQPTAVARGNAANPPEVLVQPAPQPEARRRQRKKAKRNRMRTRGWTVTAKITKPNGQIAVIYKPFVDALFGKQLTPSQQRKAVMEILRSNGNNPNDASVDYFLENTVEYLNQVNRGGA